jgi:hypothetical protein
MRRALLFAATVGALSLPRCVAAQATGPSVTVIGVVVDSVTGAPVGAARVSVGGEARGIATNALGRFALSDVPIGMRRLIVTRLGYEDREVIVQITDPMGGVQLKLMPEPLRLEGLSTKAATEGDLRGRVVDAETGEPVPYARVSLSRDAVNQVGRRGRLWSTDSLGYFLLPDIQVGGYFLRVERPGYKSQIAGIGHEVPAPPVQISLSKDYARGAALVALMSKLDTRLVPFNKTQVLSEQHLQSATSSFMDRYLMFEGPLTWGLEGQMETKTGIAGGGVPGLVDYDTGRLVLKSIGNLYIDGYKQIEPQVTLESYNPKEFYRIDFVDCRLLNTTFVFAYTYAYVEDRMMNPNKPDPQRDPLGLC